VFKNSPRLHFDIQDDFETAYADSKLEFDGNFYSKHEFPDAPNPALYVEGFGSLGMPLSTRDAEALIGHCKQAPFGSKEQTVVDTRVRDTWEIDAGKVSFQNPLWVTFISKVVPKVCGALGVNMEASKPKCELYKLLLYQPGSQ
jgi:hypothetical protein